MPHLGWRVTILQTHDRRVAVPENATSTGVPENATSTGVPENATSPSGSTVNNGTGTTPVTNGTGNETANFVDTILGIHNRERAAVNASGSVPALVWSDKLAADAKTYAEHLIATGEFTHPSAEWVAAHPTGPEGENLAGRSPQNPNELAQMAEGWVAEKKVLSERGANQGILTGSVIIRRWSGIPRKRSVARLPVVVDGTFWTAATARRATS